MSLRLLNGGLSPPNCARKIAGPLIVFTGLRFSVHYTGGLMQRVYAFVGQTVAGGGERFSRRLLSRLRCTKRAVVMRELRPTSRRWKTRLQYFCVGVIESNVKAGTTGFVFPGLDLIRFFF